MTSKTLRIGVSKPTAKLNTNKSKIQHNFSANIEYLSRHRKGQRAFVEENENKLLIFLSVKSVSSTDFLFSELVTSEKLPDVYVCKV